MIVLSSKPLRKLEDVSNIGNLIVAIVDHQYEQTKVMKYLQFLTYVHPEFGLCIDYVVLNGHDRDKMWWKEQIVKEYKDVEWLHDTYEKSLSLYHTTQAHIMVTGFDLF